MKHLMISIILITVLSYGKIISIVGTADLQGMLEPSVQKIDIDGDGKRDKVEMGGISHLATLYKQLKKENSNTVIVSAGDDLMNRYFIKEIDGVKVGFFSLITEGTSPTQCSRR